MLRLGTVRAKLTALVAFTAVVTLVSVFLLSFLMHRQLIDEVDDRVPEAMRGFEIELDDDLRDLGATLEALAGRRTVAEAMAGRDALQIRIAAAPFHEAYPDIDVATFDASGKLFGGVGLDAAPETLASVIDGLSPDGTEIRGVTRRGCEHPNGNAPPGYLMARPVGPGTLVVCLPIDREFLTNAGTKLGLELALLSPEGAAVGTTAAFPTSLLGALGSEPRLGEAAGRMWALAAFPSQTLRARSGSYSAVLALDVTDIRAVVWRHLVLAGTILALAAALSLYLGARLAGVMSTALSRLNHAQKRLADQEYVHVEALKTGDELEDLAAGFNSMVDGLKERDKLRSTFGKYMTQSVLEHLLSGKVQLGGELLTVTVLFSDIRSFTTISEKMGARDLVSLLNEYFSEMVSIIIAEDGVVDKYIGDAIMAVFGAPVPKPDDAIRAVRAAVRMRKALAALNARLVARGIAPLETGIGIHTGEVVAGNIGSEERMEYTVIGDAVNVASRLETSTKELRAPVLISDDTYARVKDAFQIRAIREIYVKGRAAPVMTYEVLGGSAAVRTLDGTLPSPNPGE